MNVKSKLKARTVRFVGDVEARAEDGSSTAGSARPGRDGGSEHNLKTELFNVFLIGLCFCLLFGGYNTLAQLTVICLSLLYHFCELSSDVKRFHPLQPLIYNSIASEIGHELSVEPFLM